MNKVTIIKLAGTIAAAVATGGAAFLPEAYRVRRARARLAASAATRSRKMKGRHVTLFLGAVCLWLLLSCSPAQSKAELQLAAITAGCQVSLDIERDAGEAGATSETEDGCRAALHAWEKAP